MSERAYDAATTSNPTPSGSPSVPKLRRRRPPNATEQKRREEWGKLWGGINSDYAKKRGWK